MPSGVLPRTYDNQVCSVARALEAIGDRWTMLVIRDAFRGVRRFDDFQQRLGIARNVLTDRLTRLVDEGILEKHAYQERPERFEYRLTEKGARPVPRADLADEVGRPPRAGGERPAAGGAAPRLRRRDRRAAAAAPAAASRSTALNAEARQPVPSAG